MELSIVSARPRSVVARVLGFVLGCAVLLAIVAPIAARFASARELFIGCAGAAGAFGLTILFTRWDRISLGGVGAAFARGSVLRFAAGAAIGSALVAAWAGLSALAGHVAWIAEPHVDLPRAALMFVAYVALAAREELAFRGYPLRRLADTLGVAAAQIIMALLFALEHRIGGASWSDALIGVGLGSLLFGGAALATRGLALPIALHAAWNFGQWTLGLKGSPGIWMPQGHAGDPAAYRTGMAVYVGLTLVAIVAFEWWRRREPRNASSTTGRRMTSSAR